jgi:hypothetical protein
MRRMLTALVFALPLCLSACASYGVHLYSDPQLLKVLDERIALTEAESDGESPFSVLMRGDSVVVIGERRNNWEYEQDMHDRYYIVYFDNRRAYVPYRSLCSNEAYASMFGPGTAAPAAVPAAPAQPQPSDVGTGPSARRDTVRVIDNDPTGGGRNARQGRNARR